MSTSRFTGTVAAAVATVSATVIVAGCGAAATGRAPADAPVPAGVPADTAPYEGDPWETRVKAAFWTEQHIHDSWNRCHVGENAPVAPGC